jgi:hypothetical protein
MIFPRANEAMTKWWVKVTALTCLTTTLLPVECINIYTNIVKGMCAASGCCIFIGYYVFVYIYDSHHQISLTKQFFINNCHLPISFPTYLWLDRVVHIALPIVTYYLWYKHITLASSIIAFVFHRMWSIINSNFTSIYIDGTPIYRINRLPAGGWRTVYIGEFLVLILSTILTFGLCN